MPKLDLKPFVINAQPRGQTERCEVCTQQFNIGTRQHLCKRCLRAVCDNCSPYKVRSYRADLQHRLHRMCKICNKQSQILNRYAEDNRVAWGQDSDMSRMWLKQLGRQSNRNAGRTSYRASLHKTNNSNIEEYDVSLNDLWASFNYSFREFIGITIDKTQMMKGIITNNKQGSSAARNAQMKVYKQILQEILGSLSEILSTVQTPLPPENILYILIFFMAHSSPYNAVIFTKSIVQWLSFEKASIEGINYFLGKMGCSDIESYKIENYLEENLDYLTHCATVNIFTAEISIEIVSSLISKKNYQELQKGIAYVLSRRKDFICKNSNRADLIQLDILKNTEGLGQSYRKASKIIDNSLDRSESRHQSKMQNSETASTILHRQEKYEELIRLNEELKIKNKNQEEEIIRLKSENNKLVQKAKKMQNQYEEKDKWSKVRKKSMIMQQSEIKKGIGNEKGLRINNGMLRPSMGSQSDELLGMFDDSKVHIDECSSENSYQSYWQEEQISEDHDQSIPFDVVLSRGSRSNEEQEFMRKSIPHDSFSKKKKTRLVKKYRCKSRDRAKKKDRMTTLSQKLINVKQQTNKKKSSRNQDECLKPQKYQQVIYEKNQEISQLKKQLQISRCNTNLAEQEIVSLKENGNELRLKQTLKAYEKTKQELDKMQQMNKQLLLKMQQLSNMLMDKQEDECNKSQQTLQALTKIYEERSKQMGDDCRIF